MTSTLSPAMAEATLDLAPEAAREVFQKIAALWECPTQIEGERLRLSFPRGAIDLQTEGERMRVLLRGDDPQVSAAVVAALEPADPRCAGR